MQACWLALCGWLLGGLAQAAETIRYCDYPVYPPISWSDGQQVRGLAPALVKRLFGALGTGSRWWCWATGGAACSTPPPDGST